MMEAGVDVVPGTFTTHEVPLAAAWHDFDFRSENAAPQTFASKTQL
jgi:hypothetical protein